MGNGTTKVFGGGSQFVRKEIKKKLTDYEWSLWRNESSSEKN